MAHLIFGWVGLFVSVVSLFHAAFHLHRQVSSQVKGLLGLRGSVGPENTLSTTGRVYVSNRHIIPSSPSRLYCMALVRGFDEKEGLRTPTPLRCPS